MSIICLLTATEKKHLKAFLESGMTQAKINRKYYTITYGNGTTFDIRIETPFKNDFGKLVMDKQMITVEV